MSGHIPWEHINLKRPYKAILAQETKAAMRAWSAGYLMALKDVLEDLQQAQRDGAETLDAAIEEVQVSISAAVFLAKALEETNEN